MATQKVTLRGKALYCMVAEHQIDRVFEDVDDPRSKGGNWSTRLELDDDNFKLYNALNLSMVRPKGQTVNLKRYEFKYDTEGKRELLGPPTVTGVEPGTAIGNGSDIAVTLEVFDFEFKKRPGKAARMLSIEVENLIPYVLKPKDDSEAVPF